MRSRYSQLAVQGAKVLNDVHPERFCSQQGDILVGSSLALLCYNHNS
jgi:hypothetical protein